MKVGNVILGALLAPLLAMLPVYAQSDVCVQYEQRLTFCGDTQTWRLRDSANSFVALALRRGQTFRANFIFGDAGSNYGDTAETIHEFQRKVYAEFTGEPLSNLVVQVEEPVLVDGYDGLRRAFPITVEGTRFVVALTVVMRPEENLQILTIDAGDRFIDRHRSWHDTILSLTKLTLETEG